MTVGSVDAVERTVHKTNEWLGDMAGELGTDDKEDAWRALSGYLQVLRDRLTLDEGAQLAAQLPHLLRGVFYEGFDPGHQPEKIRDRDVFLSLLAERAVLADAEEAAVTATAGTRVLRRHVTEGELEDVFVQLPREIRALLEDVR
ncbi:MAG TPA: DUF2267 domain-containing protein [Thermoleophilaceae bacterium]